MSMPWLMYVIAPGFVDEPAKFGLAIELTQITFPYLMFMALVALMGGMLNSIDRFAATAAAPILLNIVLISVMLLLHFGVLSLPGQALAWGVAAAGLGQFIWIALACRREGILFVLPRPRLTPGVKRLLALMVPALIGAGVVQINLVVDVILASTLPEGSVSFLYYADRVNQLPLGVVGVAVGIALLPLLVRQLRSGEYEAAQYSQNRAIEFALTLTVPAAVALIVIPGPIITVLFQRGAFDAADASATADALSAFAVGLPAYVLIKALTPGFYAREDTKTPGQDRDFCGGGEYRAGVVVDAGAGACGHCAGDGNRGLDECGVSGADTGAAGVSGIRCPPFEPAAAAGPCLCGDGGRALVGGRFRCRLAEWA